MVRIAGYGMKLFGISIKYLAMITCVVMPFMHAKINIEKLEKYITDAAPVGSLHKKNSVISLRSWPCQL